MSTPKKEVPKVPSYNLLKRIFGQNQGIDDEELKYTILDTRHSVFRDLHELAELHLATGKAPHELACFRPEKLAKHAIIIKIATSLRCKLPGDLEHELPLDFDEKFHAIFFRIEKDAEGSIKTISADLYRERVKIEEAITESLIRHQEDGAFSGHISSAQEDTAEAMPTLGEHVPGYNKRRAIIALATDRTYTVLAQEKMRVLIDEHVDKMITAKILLAIIPITPPRPPMRLSLDAPRPSSAPPEEDHGELDDPQPGIEHPKKATLYMICGGQAVGKGSSVMLLRQNIEAQDGEWSNVAKGGGDTYRPLIIDKDSVKPALFSQLTQPEVSPLSHSRVMGAHKALCQSMPHHLLIEQIFFGQDKIDLAIESKMCVVATFVTIPIEEAIKRAHERGERVGRFEDTSIILLYHKKSTLQLVNDILPNNIGEDVTLTLVNNEVDYVAPPDPPNLPRPIADIDFKEKTIVVHDQALLERFLKKSTINLKAETLELDDLYEAQPTEEITLQSFNDKLISAGYTITGLTLKEELNAQDTEPDDIDPRTDGKEDGHGKTF